MTLPLERERYRRFCNSMLGQLGVAGHLLDRDGAAEKSLAADTWFANPVSFKAAESIYSQLRQKWTAGKAQDIRLDGNLSRAALEAWFEDIETRVMTAILAGRESRDYFSDPEPERGSGATRQARGKTSSRRTHSPRACLPYTARNRSNTTTSWSKS